MTFVIKLLQIYKSHTQFWLLCMYDWYSIKTNSMLGNDFSRQYFETFFSYFFHKIGFDISCKLSKETICMKCQILFSMKNKNISKCHLLNFLPSMLSIN